MSFRARTETGRDFRWRSRTETSGFSGRTGAQAQACAYNQKAEYGSQGSKILLWFAPRDENR